MTLRLGNASTEDFLIFYHVVDQGGVSRAANVLGMFQSRVSRALARLEGVFGGLLLHKDMRSVELTALGKVVFDTAQTILFAFEEARKRIDAEKNEMVGTISLAANSGFGNIWLLPQLTPFLEEHAELSISLRTNEEESQLDAGLVLGKTDIAILTKEPDFRDSLVSFLLCQYGYAFFASDKYLAKHGTPKSLKDLSNHNIITPSHEFLARFPSPAMSDVNAQFAAVGHSRLLVANMANSAFGVLNHMGIGILPVFYNQILKPLCIKDADFIQDIKSQKYIVYSKSLEGSKRHQAILEYIKSCAKKLETFKCVKH